MLVSELIERLEEMDQNAEVRVAMQPQWAFEYSLNRDIVENEDGSIVYLSEKNQEGYLPGEISEQLGWG